ncbi:DNA topoisomerase 1 [Alphaproteobacteria bacterium]|nr:DNA topoisomerase 1 [Alphaproteobacteria bacterium]GHT90407.1 DNA topoisomerase 1 [Alphaproteobacteria bacterium]
MRLVIVESPAKAKTINKYLGKDYSVMASYGHIRDLLAKNGSVKPDDNFSMVWEISDRGKKCISDISKQLKSCDELLLATDPDREGEAISWHIREVLNESRKLAIPVRRIVFHEITKNAIKEAIAHPRDIDIGLVDSYLARRALDYLVGFTISPILWRKLPGSKSAGRVQSVALRIVVDREVEIEQFESQEYWTIEAKFAAKNKKIFGAKLTHFEGKKLGKFSVNNQEDAFRIRDALLTQDFIVTSTEEKTVKRNPAPPFITSTLQQEASRKLGFTAKKTMQVAQNLYEGIDVGGETIALITYMRTDSINLSKEAIEKIRNLISTKYGNDFIPSTPRVYKTKVKNAQEAHEAVRPVDADIAPESLKGKLSADQLRLYTLIWKRAVASQMSSAEFNQVQADISDIQTTNNVFRAVGSTLKFEGFLKVYVEGKDESDQPEDEEAEGILPPLAKGDEVGKRAIESFQHFTTPPPRFSEASLVKKLEELGIGRPSTYATILQVLRDRGYVKLEHKHFVPEIRGRLVTSFLMSFFDKYLEYGFTADMEQSLDDVSNGTKPKLDLLMDFWTGFCGYVSNTKGITITNVIDRLNESLGSFLFKSNEDGTLNRVCPECKAGELSLKIGKYGSFLGCSRYPECNYVNRLDSSQQNAEGDAAAIEAAEYPKFLGVSPDDQMEVSLRKGPYGLYVQKDVKTPPMAPEEQAEQSAEKPTKKVAQKDAKATPVSEKPAGKSKKKVAKKDTAPKPIRSSIPKFIDPSKMDLNTALWLLKLPNSLGTYENDDVKVGIGKFGPYILFREKYISIRKPEDVLTMTLDNAVEIIKNRRERKPPEKK